MRLYFLLPFIALWHFVHPAATPFTQLVNATEASVLRVGSLKTHDGDTYPSVCTGEVIAANRVLTAAHCLGERMTAGGIVAKVLKKDEVLDLALLSVPTGHTPAIQFRHTAVERSEDLIAVGYALSLTRPTALKVRVIQVDVSPNEGMAPGILVQGAYIGGMSGGPVVDGDGYMVGIVQQASGEDAIGYGVGITLIQAFLVGIE